MGANVGALGDILGDGEEVMRGLNPAHCEGGLPTEGCFILKANDAIDDGPSYGIFLAPGAQPELAPLGVRQGISAEIFATLLPHDRYGIARMNVGRALEQVRGRGVAFRQKDDEDWGQHRGAHAMITGHQGLEPRTRKDLQRYLAKIASEGVVKSPVRSET